MNRSIEHKSLTTLHIELVLFSTIYIQPYALINVRKFTLIAVDKNEMYRSKNVRDTTLSVQLLSLDAVVCKVQTQRSLFILAKFIFQLPVLIFIL